MNTTTPPTQTPRGRWFCVLGMLITWGAIGGYLAQLAMKQLVVPWYVAIFGTIGTGLMLLGFLQRPTVWRGMGLLLVAAVCGMEWWYLTALSKVPEYAGPAAIGAAIPAFSTTLADGRPFTDDDLRQGQPTVLTFFRGRW